MALAARSPKLARLSLVAAAALTLWRQLGGAWVLPAQPRASPISSSGRRLGVAMAGKAEDGIFTPVVQGAKAVIGEDGVTKMRGQVIKAHGDLMQKFLDTSDTPFGKIALKQIFDLADADGSGQLDKEELKTALKSLGFEWLENDAKLDKVLGKGDKDGDDLIDFDEFVKAAPGVLKQNLIKLAKSNGGKLGFLS
uniref:EF-hand domain-containing protein n=2 Tax=Pyrodinium bahamense TaxID=73915 RepID=A0A7S0AX37_9DINO|mmetsp:Transcript_44133/g.122761  ORF Transcript_44133/g.122761 Transcript_44133/m.122761 type:complete len:195 (+) Transcript_44133:81-665(+)